jgi:hypothetical protein
MINKKDPAGRTGLEKLKKSTIITDIKHAK